MKFFKKTIFICLCALLFQAYFVVFIHASDIFHGIETQIGPESSPEKIKKLQMLLSDIDLYNGEINGLYNDIKGILIEYQLQEGIIKTQHDWGAGYFGRKTILKFQEDFGDEFKEKSKQHLKHKQLQKGKSSFIATAYYSPLPNQKKYITGTYYGDIKLNGSGKITASGKGVFPGLLAAPKNYPFGTKIYFEGIGVGVVEDRGGAIVNAGDKGHDFDRIDIWMGYGDEGLKRALKWGQRKIEGEVLEGFFPYNIRLDQSVLSKYNTIKLSPVTSSKKQIIAMQNLFKELGLYKGSIDGLYKSIKKTIIDFQFENQIIDSKDSPEGGYIGPKTVAFLKKTYPSGMFIPQSKYSFSKVQQKKLHKMIETIHKFLRTKTHLNEEKLQQNKQKIKQRIMKLILKTNKTKQKLELEYIMNNL